jgi:hypothetical protein
MNSVLLFLALAGVPGEPARAQRPSVQEQAAHARREQLLEIYGAEAAGYAIYLDASRSFFTHPFFFTTSRILIPSNATAPLPTGIYSQSRRSRDDAWQD